MSVRIVRLPMRGRLVWRCQASRWAATHLYVCVSLYAASCKSRTRRDDFDFDCEWVMRVDLGGLAGACPVCFVAICAVMRERVRGMSMRERELGD